MSNTPVNTESVPPRRRRNWLRVAGILVVALLVFVVAGYFVATSTTFLNRVILPRVGAPMGATITVSDASIKPFSSVVLKDLKVQTTGRVPLVTSEEVRVRHDLGAILGGVIKLHSLEMISPTIELVQEPSGESNMDPVTKFLEEPSEEPLRIDFGKTIITDGTIRQVRIYDEDHRDVTEISNFDFTADNLKNGGLAKIVTSADVNMVNNPPAPGTNSTLQGKLTGQFDVALTAELQPASIKGESRFETTSAGGALAQARGLNATFLCDITPTDIQQVLLSFQQGATSLGTFRVQGPFNMETKEGRITVQLEGVDRGLLNLAGAQQGLDFANTRISSTNVIALAQQGNAITAGGRLDVREFQVVRTNQATPPMNLATAYDVAVDLSRSNALLRGLTLSATQQNRELLSGGITSPLGISWGAVSNAVGDAALNVTLNQLNLADWKPFLGDVAPAGMLEGRMALTSKQAGNLLLIEVNGQAQDLVVVADTNQITGLGGTIQANTIVTNLQQYRIPDFKLQLSQNRNQLLTASGSGVYDMETGSGDFRLTSTADMPAVSQIMPQPDMGISSGTVTVLARVTQQGSDQTVGGEMVLTNFTGRYGSNVFQQFATRAQFDVLMSEQKAEVRKLAGQLSEQGRPGGAYDLTATYLFTNSQAQFALKLADFNQNGLRPFIEPMLTGKELTSVAINGGLSGQYMPEGASRVQGDLQLTNLVVRDLASTAPYPALAAGFGMDVTLENDVAEIRQFQLALTPTERARNVVQMTGRVDMANTNAIQGNLRLASSGLDLTRYYDIFENTNQPSPAVEQPRGTISKSAPAPAPQPEQDSEPFETPLSNFVAEIALDKFYLREVEITNLQTRVNINGGRIVIQPMQLWINTAPVKGNVDLNMGVPGYRYDVSLEAGQVPLTPLVNSFMADRRGQVGGTFTGKAQIAGAGTTGARIKESLKGSFDFGSTNLNLAIPTLRSRLLKSIIDVVAIIPQVSRDPSAAGAALKTALLGGGASGQKGGFTQELLDSPLNVIEARGTMGGGRIDLASSLLQSPAFQASAQGAIQIADVLTNSTLDLPLSISLRRSLAESVNLVPQGTPTNAVYVQLPDYVTIKGTVGEPKQDINKLALLGTALKVGGNIPGVDQKTSDLIQGLGGILTGNRDSGTNAPQTGPRTNQPGSSVGGLLQGILRGATGATNEAPQSSTNATPSAARDTNQPANTVGGLLQGLLRSTGSRQPSNAAPANVTTNR